VKIHNQPSHASFPRQFVKEFFLAAFLNAGEAADAALGMEPGAPVPGLVSTTKEMMTRFVKTHLPLVPPHAEGVTLLLLVCVCVCAMWLLLNGCILHFTGCRSRQAAYVTVHWSMFSY
jgi:hypothetical protein